MNGVLRMKLAVDVDDTDRAWLPCHSCCRRAARRTAEARCSPGTWRRAWAFACAFATASASAGETGRKPAVPFAGCRRRRPSGSGAPMRHSALAWQSSASCTASAASVVGEPAFDRVAERHKDKGRRPEGRALTVSQKVRPASRRDYQTAKYPSSRRVKQGGCCPVGTDGRGECRSDGLPCDVSPSCDLWSTDLIPPVLAACPTDRSSGLTWRVEMSD